MPMSKKKISLGNKYLFIQSTKQGSKGMMKMMTVIMMVEVMMMAMMVMMKSS